jgi:hypothetical protein
MSAQLFKPYMSITPEAIQSLIWKRQSKAGCELGTYCNDSDRFYRSWETLRFRHRPKKDLRRGLSAGVEGVFVSEQTIRFEG